MFDLQHIEWYQSIGLQSSIRKTLGDFKRTHHDNWEQHKLKFSEEQLAVLTDLIVPPSHYAWQVCSSTVIAHKHQQVSYCFLDLKCNYVQTNSWKRHFSKSALTIVWPVGLIRFVGFEREQHVDSVTTSWTVHLLQKLCGNWVMTNEVLFEWLYNLKYN